MVFPNSAIAAVEAIADLKRIGYDYVELSLRHLAALGKKDFGAVVRELQHSAIRGEACHNFFPDYMKLVGSDVDYLLIEDYAKSSLEKAAEVGAETVVFGSGVSRQVPEGFSNARAREQLIALLDRISDIARTFGISIVIEPLNKEECNIINSTSEAVQLVEDVEKHNIRLLIDFYHYCSEIEPTFKNAEKYLQHIHFARPCGRGFPQRMEEDERYAQFFNELRRMKYDKRISIEAYTTDFPRDARNALDFLHAAFRGDAQQAVREL